MLKFLTVYEVPWPKNYTRLFLTKKSLKAMAEGKLQYLKPLKPCASKWLHLELLVLDRNTK